MEQAIENNVKQTKLDFSTLQNQQDLWSSITIHSSWGSKGSTNWLGVMVCKLYKNLLPVVFFVSLFTERLQCLRKDRTKHNKNKAKPNKWYEFHPYMSRLDHVKLIKQQLYLSKAVHRWTNITPCVSCINMLRNVI